jgi:hypothetical protein
LVLPEPGPGGAANIRLRADKEYALGKKQSPRANRSRGRLYIGPRIPLVEHGREELKQRKKLIHAIREVLAGRIYVSEVMH